MARDDWRLRIEVDEGDAPSLLERLGLVETDADELARDLGESKLAVTHDEDTVFVYAETSLELEPAKALVQRELDDLEKPPKEIVGQHWLASEDRWDSEPAGPGEDEEVLAAGYAPWEVRIPCRNHQAARGLADRLESEGYGVVRRWRYVIAGCSSEADANELAERLHGEVEPGGDLVYEGLRGHPFAIVGPF